VASTLILDQRPERTGRNAPARRPVGARTVLAATTVLLGLWVLGPRGEGFTTDGLVLERQVAALARGSWVVAHPAPTVDPSGAHVPDGLALRAEGGASFSPYGKHPAVPLLLLGPWLLSGRAGAELVVLSGLVAAGWVTARLVDRLVPGAGRATFWLLTLGSALTVHGFILWFHGWAVALTAVAVRAVVELRLGPAGGRRRALLALGGSLVVLTLLRSEGVLVGLAVGASMLVMARRTRSAELWLAVVVAPVVVVVTAVAERFWLQTLLGETEVAASPGGSGFVIDRLSGSFSVLLLASPDPAGGAVRLGVVALLAVTLWRVRRGLAGRELRAVVLAGATVYAVALVLVPLPVFGLVPAAPLLVLPLLLPPGPGEGTVPRQLAAMAGVYLTLVAFTVYGSGAGSDWAGRYALPAVPMLAPLVAARLLALPARVGRRDARMVVGALIAMSVLTVPVGWWMLRSSAHDARSALAAIRDEVDRHGPAPAGVWPVVITTHPNFGRLLLAEDDHLTVLLVADPVRDLPGLLAELGRTGIEEVLLVGSGEVLDDAVVSGLGSWEGGPWRLLTPGTAARTLSRSPD
jgi:hypothetical protein